MVVHPGRDAADHEHLDQGTGARPMSGSPEITLGVSLYSYGGDFLVTMIARGLPGRRRRHGRDRHRDPRRHAHRRATRALPREWVDRWLVLVDGAGPRPTCYSSWLDTRLHRDRALVARRGGRDPPARPRARAQARLLDRAAEARRRVARPRYPIRSGARPVERVLPDAAELGIGSPRRSTLRPRSDRGSSTTTWISSARPGRSTSAC